MLSRVFYNPALTASLLSVLIAQGVKVPIYYWSERKWDVSKMFSTGGMPSSHSAAVTSLATVVGLRSGMSSMLFGASVVFAVVVMYDAAGIRRHAGEQAIAINQLEEKIGNFIQHPASTLRQDIYQKKLKEMLGHQPSEVVMGAILGIVLGFVVNQIAAAIL
nr:divergent PAP2 family protein [Bacilli bacterium]